MKKTACIFLLTVIVTACIAGGVTALETASGPALPNGRTGNTDVTRVAMDPGSAYRTDSALTYETDSNVFYVMTISATEAKLAALFQAGFSEADVTILNVELVCADGRLAQEVVFSCGGVVYEYYVDATTGVLLSYNFYME